MIPTIPEVGSTDSSSLGLQPDEHKTSAVLLIDDEPLMGLRLGTLFRSFAELNSCYLYQASNIDEALAILSTQAIQLAILDKDLGPGGNGIDSIPELLGLKPNLQILVHTGSSEITDVVSAMKKGALGYIQKSSEDALVAAQIEKALFHAKIAQEKTVLERTNTEEAPLDFKCKSASMRQILKKLQVVSESSRPVLLLGETGVGKTTIARAIHEYRKELFKQNERSFYGINLTALSSNLIERELFGNEAGAFTGAGKRQIGFFELANGGTLFIDEIGDISHEIQTKLLKAIEEGKFFRVGGNKEIYSQFKLVCATNKNLSQLVEQGKFRDDLLARISTFQITVPPLRERSEDIPDLIASLLPKVCRESLVNISFDEIPKDFIQALTQNPPRLNIRGLEIALHQLLTLSPKDANGKKRLERWTSLPEFADLSSRKRIADFNIKSPASLGHSGEYITDAFPGLPRFLSDLEEKILLEAKIKFGSNRKASEKLGISESAVSLKLKHFNRSIRDSKSHGH